MKLFCRVLLLLFCVSTICSAENDDYLDVECHDAKDCYVVDNSLALACYHSVNKCKCQNTFMSDFYLKWENKQCLSSKYGPCGTKGKVTVGCLGGFVCVDNQCRDPKDTRPEAVKVTPFVFTESKCSDGCSFDGANLRCDHKSDHCECAKIYVADGTDDYWNIRNYDGDNDCSVGKFGPCGTKNGITIGCHGDGITCVSGTCLNANKLISDVDEDCVTKKNCKEGLLCSEYNTCIEPFSLEKDKMCKEDEECQKGLKCTGGEDEYDTRVCQ